MDYGWDYSLSPPKVRSKLAQRQKARSLWRNRLGERGSFKETLQCVWLSVVSVSQWLSLFYLTTEGEGLIEREGEKREGVCEDERWSDIWHPDREWPSSTCACDLYRATSPVCWWAASLWTEAVVTRQLWHWWRRSISVYKCLKTPMIFIYEWNVRVTRPEWYFRHIGLVSCKLR